MGWGPFGFGVCIGGFWVGGVFGFGVFEVWGGPLGWRSLDLGFLSWGSLGCEPLGWGASG